MIIIARSLSELSFSKLMEVYLEGNLEKAREEHRGLSEYAGLQLAEQDFYQYLKECFFTAPGARYAVLEENGEYRCALRWEPYLDGVLISALETAPSRRRKGHAQELLRAVLSVLDTKAYSHVSKKNEASLAVHRKCGFREISDRARYLDGSVNSWAYTLCCESGRSRPEAELQTGNLSGCIEK